MATRVLDNPAGRLGCGANGPVACSSLTNHRLSCRAYGSTLSRLAWSCVVQREARDTQSGDLRHSDIREFESTDQLEQSLFAEIV